ncbi:MAG: hypothetical protein RML72_06070 [Bacteroidia bacterium]|nr:hypothetical protein [Bacteroidia bacterium]MDW8158426.1 hypothetical protein [Bacteroidia bacterium]
MPKYFLSVSHSWFVRLVAIILLCLVSQGTFLQFMLKASTLEFENRYPPTHFFSSFSSGGPLITRKIQIINTSFFSNFSSFCEFHRKLEAIGSLCSYFGVPTVEQYIYLPRHDTFSMESANEAEEDSCEEECEEEEESLENFTSKIYNCKKINKAKNYFSVSPEDISISLLFLGQNHFYPSPYLLLRKPKFLPLFILYHSWRTFLSWSFTFLNSFNRLDFFSRWHGISCSLE